MYLEHFKLNEFPFALTPNLNFFCSLTGHQEALNVLLLSLNNGEGFIKIIGEVGSGKTILCRKLLNCLENEFITAYIPNPDLPPHELRKALAWELNIDTTHIEDQHDLLLRINQRLLELHQQGKRVVLILDEAQALSLESLESLRLLTNLETEKSKLLQIVMFGQYELDDMINQPKLRQLKLRISFSYYLPVLNRHEMDDYLIYRLTKANYTAGLLFNKKACDALYKASKGIPRIINILCHKAMLIAYGRGEYKISHKMMLEAIGDTESVFVHKINYLIPLLLGTIVTFTFILYLLFFKEFI